MTESDLLEDVRRVVAECIAQRTVLDVTAIAEQLAPCHETVPFEHIELAVAEAAAKALVPMKLGLHGRETESPPDEEP